MLVLRYYYYQGFLGEKMYIFLIEKKKFMKSIMKLDVVLKLIVPTRIVSLLLQKLYTVCDVSGKELGSISAAERHMKGHKRTPYRCETCGKSFRYPSALIKHSRVHSGDRPFKCQFCGKGFIQTAHRNKHESDHCSLRFPKSLM